MNAEPFAVRADYQTHPTGIMSGLKTKGLTLNILYAALFCIVGLGIAALCGSELSSWKQWKQTPRTVALIDDLDYQRSGRRGSGRTVVKYTFNVLNADGSIQSYTKKYVFKGTQRTYRIGDSIMIHYQPSDPNLTWPVDAMTIDTVLWLGFVAAFWNSVSWWHLFNSIAAMRIEKRLAQGCTLLPGEVVSCEGLYKSGNKRRSFYLVMDYRFVNPQGEEISGRLTQKRNDLCDEHVPTNGTPLRVAYIDDRCYKVL